MTSPAKYPTPQEGDGVLLRLREDYEQAVLDLFEADPAAQEVRPALEVVGHTSNFLDNMRPAWHVDSQHSRLFKELDIEVCHL